MVVKIVATTTQIKINVARALNSFGTTFFLITDWIKVEIVSILPAPDNKPGPEVKAVTITLCITYIY